MTYRMNHYQYNKLRQSLTHDEIIDYVNDNLGLINIKQKSIVAEDVRTGEKQSIKVDPIRIINEVSVYQANWEVK